MFKIAVKGVLTLVFLSGTAMAQNTWENSDVAARQNQINEMHGKITSDPFLNSFLANPDAPQAISSGVSLPRPFGFDDGYGVTLFGYADYDKVVQKLKPEGITPLPWRDQASNKIFALVYVDVTAYSKTSFGPAYVARVFVHATISQDATNKLLGRVDSEFTRQNPYPMVLMTWKYWEGGAVDARVGGRELLQWPQDPAKMNVSFAGDVKTADIKTYSGKPILSFKFDGRNRLNKIGRTTSNGLIIAITPGNRVFNPSVAKAVYNIVPTQGVAYDGFIPYDKTKDSFRASGTLDKDLKAIGFNHETSLWQIKPYYKGLFIANPPSVESIGR